MKKTNRKCICLSIHFDAFGNLLCRDAFLYIVLKFLIKLKFNWVENIISNNISKIFMQEVGASFKLLGFDKIEISKICFFFFMNQIWRKNVGCVTYVSGPALI